MTRKIAFALVMASFAALGAGMTLLAVQAKPAAAAEEIDQERIVQRMPALDGKNLTATLIEVTYPPGVGSDPHLHPCPVIGYVIEGTIESQVRGQPAASYTAGQTFYEPPRGVHAVSRNPSKTRSARLLAYFLCDQPGPLSLDVPPASAVEKKN
jgi:quercetin dioxygenase-like cupin family protein